jgi:alpha-ketoglutarate-dependent taurine dioxygenase
VRAVEITPNIGTELLGIQLSSLTSAQKDDLALLAAERGVVVFRDQDFADIGPERQREFGRHFSPPHVHQMSGNIKDYPENLPVYRDFVSGAVDNEISNNVSSIKWHLDMSYEVYASLSLAPTRPWPLTDVEPMCRNGMGTTIFYPLEVPTSGGDTLYLSTTAAYEHLSEDFRSRIEGLSATHPGFSQAAVHDHRGRYICQPIETVHLFCEDASGSYNTWSPY